MKNTILILLSCLFLLSAVSVRAQEGNATITAVDLKYGTRKHTEAFRISMGQVTTVGTQEVLFSINNEKVYKGKEADALGPEYIINLDSLNGEGTVNSAADGKVLLTVKNRTLYQGDKALITAEAYNAGKLKLFFREPIKGGKVRGSYAGKRLSAKETVLVMIVLSQDMLGLQL
ncbi:MAG: hypothetical protein H6581_16005 [Bacteroidia bacterium]|nr:hypothetical protein [Bacteroidia bacterium]